MKVQTKNFSANINLAKSDLNEKFIRGILLLTSSILSLNDNNYNIVKREIIKICNLVDELEKNQEQSKDLMSGVFTEFNTDE